MEDIFWRRDKHQVEGAVRQLGYTLLKHRQSRALFYAIQSQEKSFDRCTSREYWTMPHTFVETFVKWDLHQNVLFAVGCLILSQRRVCAPIGCPLSAEMAHQWCAWREMVCFGKKGVHNFWMSVVQGLRTADVQSMPTVTMPHEHLFLPLSAVDSMLPSSHIPLSAMYTTNWVLIGDGRDILAFTMLTWVLDVARRWYLYER